MTGQRAGFDLSDYLQLGRKCRQIGGTHRVAITRGSGKGRDVAIGGDGLGENSSGGVEKVLCFFRARMHLRSVLLDKAACILKAQEEGLGWWCGHGEMIVEGKIEIGRFLTAPRGARARRCCNVNTRKVIEAADSLKDVPDRF
jgi:hypothetical protein